MSARLQLRGDTLANWLKYDPVLMEREVALIASNPNKPKVYDLKKVGDGTSKFSELPMLGYECLQELGDSQQFPMSQKATSENFSTDVFTKSSKANAVIRKLFIDTSGFTGSVSTDGIKIGIIARNVSNQWGLRIDNGDNELLGTIWMTTEQCLFRGKTNGIFVYVEYSWENMDISSRILDVELTKESFNKRNDPRTFEKKIGSEDILDGSISKDKLSFEIKEPDMLEYEDTKFFAGDVLNELDFEGFNATPSVWKPSSGSRISPIITITTDENIMHLPYTRKFSISSLSTDYNPYFVVVLSSLKNVKIKSFSFFIEIDNLGGNVYTAFDGVTDLCAYGVKWGVDTKVEGNKKLSSYTSYISMDIRYIDFNNKKWAFVSGKFWVDDISKATGSPSFLINFKGGTDNIGKATLSCGWTFVSGEIKLKPFFFYSYKKNLYNLFTEITIPDKSITEDKLADSVNISTTTLTGGVYGQAGDSISEGAGLQTLLDNNDEYLPLVGTKKATYGYYIAKLNRMQWANYGISGSTLGYVIANGTDRNGFSKENGRYTQMLSNLTHISIFFGWNDAAYGPVMKREDWLKNKYGKTIYYPTKTSLIGTMASDGTPFTTQEQYDAVNSVTGSVGDVSYDKSSDYFTALYVGTSDDTTNTTFFGAYNIVIKYLIEKYPLSKILLIVPFGCTKLIRQCVRDVAKKYGLSFYDFSDSNSQMFRQREDNPSTGIIGSKSISQFRIDTLTHDGLHPNEDGYRYMFPSINTKLMSI